MAGPLDSLGQPALLAFCQAGLFAGLNLPVNVYITLQGLEVLIVKIWYIGSVFKYAFAIF